MTEGEKSTTKWEGCERFSAFLNDEDPAVVVAAVRCIKYVMQAVYKMPQEEYEKRAKFTENIFIKSGIKIYQFIYLYLFIKNRSSLFINNSFRK